MKEKEEIRKTDGEEKKKNEVKDRTIVKKRVYMYTRDGYRDSIYERGRRRKEGEGFASFQL